MPNSRRWFFHSRRKKLLILPRVQLAIVLYAIGLSAISMLVPKMFTEFTISSSHHLEKYGLHPDSVVGIQILIVFIISIGFGFYLSNIIAGPLFRIHKSMKAALEEGRREPVQLRKFDYFQDIAATFNELLKKLPEKESDSEESQAKSK
jgi:hypothetical protein